MKGAIPNGILTAIRPEKKRYENPSEKKPGAWGCRSGKEVRTPGPNQARPIYEEDYAESSQLSRSTFMLLLPFMTVTGHGACLSHLVQLQRLNRPTR